MIKANETMSAVLAACEPSATLSIAILSYFGKGSKEAESLPMLRQIVDVERSGPHEADLESALMINMDGAVIAELVAGSAWFDW